MRASKKIRRKKLPLPPPTLPCRRQEGCVVSLDNGRGRFLEAEIVIICASYTHLQPSFCRLRAQDGPPSGRNLSVKESTSDTSRRCWDRPVERCFNLPSSTEGADASMNIRRRVVPKSSCLGLGRAWQGRPGWSPFRAHSLNASLLSVTDFLFRTHSVRSIQRRVRGERPPCTSGPLSLKNLFSLFTHLHIIIS